MQPQARLITLQAVTFLHPGTGQTTGVVDLPIQREVHTGFPMIAASGLKGSLRDKAEQRWENDQTAINILFGSSVSAEDKGTSAGALSVTDARILAFPVRSLQQVFVWVTCPQVIQRLLRDSELIGFKEQTLVHLKDLPTLNEDKGFVITFSPIKDKLVLEELLFEVTPNEYANAYVGKVAKLFESLLADDTTFDSKRLVMISDVDFQHLVRYATQVSARIKLNDRKTTDGDGGNLWYEETLPPETLFYALALCHNPRQDNKTKPQENTTLTDAQSVAEKFGELLSDGFLQIGGNETVGQGWCCVKVNNNLTTGNKP